MNSISQSIARLSALRHGIATDPDVHADRLHEMIDFGSNPGALRARIFLPSRLAAGAALVVVLHGCTQTASGYDRGSGWSRLAEEHGFALLFPEQQRANNPNLCFNWFDRNDARRGQGEALSISQMIAAMIDRHGLATDRIYVTGLSAGGAMAAVMLATYPDLFAGGAVIAGLPYGTAWTVPDALTRMRGQGLPDEVELAALVRGASGHVGAWPTLSIWHGGADHTVSPANAAALRQQWLALHGVGPDPADARNASGVDHRIWRDQHGAIVVEEYLLAGMGHGTPLDAEYGQSGPQMLDVGLSSTRTIAARWRLVPTDSAPALGQRTRPAPKPASAADPSPAASPVQPMQGIERTIRDALRSAGLLR